LKKVSYRPFGVFLPDGVISARSGTVLKDAYGIPGIIAEREIAVIQQWRYIMLIIKNSEIYSEQS